MPHLEFRLPVAMAERKIRTVVELTRRLNEHGHSATSANMTRYMKDNPPALTLPFLTALCNTLECQLSDLFRWVPERESGTVVAEAAAQDSQGSIPPAGRQWNGTIAS